jgi:hypothetical protein
VREVTEGTDLKNGATEETEKTGSPDGSPGTGRNAAGVLMAER